MAIKLPAPPPVSSLDGTCIVSAEIFVLSSSLESVASSAVSAKGI